MTRVASLYLPQLAIERLRRSERPVTPREQRAPSASLPAPIDDDPGACSVPRGGGWRPGARWARMEGEGAARRTRGGEPTKAQLIAQAAKLPAHQQPPMRMLGRRSEPVEHPFKAIRTNEGSRGSTQIRGALPGWDRPTILIECIGQHDVVASACPVARALGLRPGMFAAHARALIADLEVWEADAAADRAWLDRLALHAVAHWTPNASVSGVDGLWLDLSGTAHLFGGEERFCAHVVRFLGRLGITAHIAIAGTPGAAHALARYGGLATICLDQGGEAEALAALPVSALRLEPSALTSAARFGLERVADLLCLPRGPLARRLGMATITRLDQALGHVAEPITPVVPFEAPMVSRRLLEPIGTPESITQVISDMVDDLIAMLHARGLGLRNVLLIADRIDGPAQRVTIGASRATRDARHLKRLLGLKLDRIAPGLGIEAMHLILLHGEPLGMCPAGSLVAEDGASADLAPAIDQLVGRAGEASVFRTAPHESDVPERAVRRVGPLAEPGRWPCWKRPVRLLARPEPLTHVLALLPDHPPRRFTWRGKPYHVVAGDGPERIHGEWWRSDAELWAIRDYFRVEVEGGERFWLFRRGDGIEPETGDLSWHIHGLFG